MVTVDCGQRFLSSTSPGNDGQAADWFAGCSHPSYSPRSYRLRSGCTAEPGGNAAVAILMVWATGILRALHPLAGFARAFAGTCVVALSRSGRDFFIVGGDHAGEMVF